MSTEVQGIPHQEIPKPNTTGIINGPSHANGGVPLAVPQINEHREVEGGEYLLCAHAWIGMQANKKPLSFIQKTNRQICDALFSENHCLFEEGVAQPGDFVICKKAVDDPTIRDVSGTAAEILTNMQTQHGCKGVPSITPIMADGGPIADSDGRLKRILKKYLYFLYPSEIFKTEVAPLAPISEPTPPPVPQSTPDLLPPAPTPEA